MTIKLNYYSLLALLCMSLCFVACTDDWAYQTPEAKTELQNDCIKRSLGPNLVGANIEFVYAMALGKEQGKLVSARVEATLDGATGTYLEHRSFHTGTGGQDVGVVVGDPSVTVGKVTTVNFTADTCAASLRYYYVIPEEARGKELSFTFYVTDSNGKTISYKMGPYKVSNMDMKLDMILPTDSYFSIADMAVYTAAEALANPSKADLVYMYRRLTTVNYLHSFVSPGGGSEYLEDLVVDPSIDNVTPILKTFGAIDQHLARNQYGVFIDDLDFHKIDFSNAPSFGINLKKDAGVWVETANGEYRAFIYVNNVNNVKREMTVSIKRLKMK
jgi:hypothetical protein